MGRFFKRLTALEAYKEGQAGAREVFERELAVLREQLADAMSSATSANTRADNAADTLLQHLGTKAISAAGREEETARIQVQAKVTEAILASSNGESDFALDDPRGRFSKDPAAAYDLSGDN